MDPDLLAADEELVEVWYGIDNPDLVEEEAVVGIGDAGDMETGDAVETVVGIGDAGDTETGDAVETNEEAMADDAVVMLEEALC